MLSSDKSKSPIVGELIFLNLVVNVFALITQLVLFVNKFLPLATYSALEPTLAAKRQVAIETLGISGAITLVTIALLAILNSGFLDRLGMFGHSRSNILLPAILLPGLLHAPICGFLILSILG